MYVGTSRGVYHVNVEERERCHVWLKYVAGDEPVAVDDDLIATMRVMIEGPGQVERLKDGARKWALATLTTGEYGFGQYEVTMGVLDEDEELDPKYGWQTITWNGRAELVPAQGE